jgi:hypothetical protein
MAARLPKNEGEEKVICGGRELVEESEGNGKFKSPISGP